MNAGRNATRRNRNIGTVKHGHGQDNRLVLPVRLLSKSGVYHYENLKNYKTVLRDAWGYRINFLVEETRKDCWHACTVDDIMNVLHHVPPDDLENIDLIVLRQSKRKEEILNPTWGRWIAYAEIDEFCGSAITLETFTNSKPMRWSKSLAPDVFIELERLQADGHSITITKRHHVISSTLESVRSTQLYRTLLHEIGHHVDNKRNPQAFNKKSLKDKEAFAHKYADKLRDKLTQEGVVPFARMLNIKSIEEDNLRLSDFTVFDSPSASA